MASSEEQVPEPVRRATARGHVVENDPPAAMTAVRRWTCILCGDAVLEREGVIYGAATTRNCPFVEPVL